MGFGQWYLRRGRIDRRTYWLHYVLPLVGLSILAVLADLALGNVDYSASAGSDSANASFQVGWVSVVISLLTIVPSISSSVTRLHDRGHAAWWLLLGLVPLVGGILIFVQTGCLPGDGGPNRYGPPPVGGRPLPDPGYPSTYA